MQTPLRAYHPRKNAKQTAPARIMPGGATCIEEPFLIRKCREKEATSACLRAKQLSVDTRSSKKTLLRRRATGPAPHQHLTRYPLLELPLELLRGSLSPHGFRQ